MIIGLRHSLISTVVFIFLCFSFGASQEINPNGYNVFKYDNGKVSSEGEMLNGKPEGIWKTYYENGQLKTIGNRLDHKLDSIWEFYNEEGKLTDRITYRKGKKNGIHEVYQLGKLRAEENYKENIQHGETRYYYENNKLHKVVPFVSGKENGKGIEYARDGRIISLLTYKEGFLRKSIKLNRMDKLNRKQGFWQDYHINGKVKWEGNFLDNTRNGVFKYYDESGDLVEIIKYEDDIIMEDAEESIVLDIRNEYDSQGRITSSGGYKDGQKYGTHRYYDSSGNIESGIIYEFGKKMAEGIIDKNGSFQGPWKLYYSSGELRAEGDYKDGKKTKDWVYYHKNGKVEQKGKYQKGKPHGEWKWYYADGNLHREELYRKGREDGLSIEYDPNGEIITEGEFIDGLREGVWFYNVGDHTEKGNYSDGEKNGIWKHYYDNGQLNFKGEFINGMAIGKHKSYHRSGKLKEEGKYNSGFKDGDWKRYDEAGQILWVITYENGIERKVDGKRIKPEYEELELEN